MRAPGKARARKKPAAVTKFILPDAVSPAGQQSLRSAPAEAVPLVVEESAAAISSAAEETAETRAAISAGTPLEYMLRVMRDPAVEPARRDEMAKLALPYVHPKPSAIEHTGKDGGPIEISDVSEADIVRRICFTMARAARAKADSESKNPGERPGSPRGNAERKHL
jgi:hypothetical protein